MFHLTRNRAKSEKSRPCRAPMVPEALETRDVPAANPVLAGLGLDLGVDRRALAAIVPLAAPASTNGAAGQMPAVYDGQTLTVNMKEMPADASASLIGKNSSINTIYATNDLDEEQDFKPVIDAIQGDGFNPLWRQVLIVFNQGVAPHQFSSDEEIKAAAAGPHPQITLVVTDEVYRCSVVRAGHKG